MKKLQVTLAAAAAVALFASGAQACEWHQQHVMASAAPVAEQPATPAASAQLTPLPIVIEEAKAEITTQQQCPDGATDCAPVSQ